MAVTGGGVNGAPFDVTPPPPLEDDPWVPPSDPTAKPYQTGKCLFKKVLMVGTILKGFPIGGHVLQL